MALVTFWERWEEINERLEVDGAATLSAREMEIWWQGSEMLEETEKEIDD